jgi:branched-chain amino acid transport system permease protein
VKETVAAFRKTVSQSLDDTKLGKRPLRWYTSGWRFGLFWLVVAILFPYVITDQSIQTSAISIGIYVMLALGLNIVVGFAGLLDLGYVAFYVIGSYTVAVFTSGEIADSHGNPHVIRMFSVWELIPLAAILAGVFGVLLGAPTLRLRGDYLAIVTLGFGEIVPDVFRNIPFFFQQNGMSAIPPADIGSISFTDPFNQKPWYFVVLALVVIIVIAVVSLRDSSLGRAWVAIREDETAAATSGINLVRTKLLAFGLGAVTGGIGGAINAAYITSITPNDFNFNVSITVLIMIVLGGIGSVAGVILGAIILRFFDVYLLQKLNDLVHSNSLFSSTGSPLHFFDRDLNIAKFSIYGLVLVLMVLLRPQGLIPNRRRQRELKGIGAAPEGTSAVGLFEKEEAEAVGSLDTSQQTEGIEFAGSGSDAYGRDGDE